MRRLDFRSLYLLSRESTTVRWRTVRERKSSFWCWEAAPDVAGRAAQSSAASVWTHGRTGWWWWRRRGRYGWSVAASHWCALSYVGINHDSEMTYFLTPQTNSTFNRSQGLCQTTFSPCSLSKKLHVGLDYRDIIQRIYFFYFFFNPRHHLPLCCNLELSKLLDVNFLLLISSPTYDQSVPHPFLNPLNCLA